MSTTPKDGGPAFPQPIVNVDGCVRLASNYFSECAGMSLRDYFAAAALQGLLAIYGGGERSVTVKGDTVVADAYLMADAMIAEREKGRA